MALRADSRMSGQVMAIAKQHGGAWGAGATYVEAMGVGKH